MVSSWFPQKPFQYLGGKNPKDWFLKTGKPGKTGKTLKLIWPHIDALTDEHHGHFTK